MPGTGLIIKNIEFMEIIKTDLDGVLVVSPRVFGDDRGFFFESFSKKRYEEAGITGDFVQDNISFSRKGTIRGLHYQIGDNVQGKLCQVLDGEVLDVAVDIRFGSPTFGQWHAEVLSSENKKQLWVPGGFAHGFSVLSETALFMYKCTGYYSKEDERAIRFDDPDLNIDWRTGGNFLSEKDAVAGNFKDIPRDFIYKV